jgi:hypothetical protein
MIEIFYKKVVAETAHAILEMGGRNANFARTLAGAIAAYRGKTDRLWVKLTTSGGSTLEGFQIAIMEGNYYYLSKFGEDVMKNLMAGENPAETAEVAEGEQPAEDAEAEADGGNADDAGADAEGTSGEQTA